MKTKIKTISYNDLIKKKRYKHFKPKNPSFLLSSLIKLLSKEELKKTNFSYTTKNMELVSKKEPCLFLMNHSCFLDLKIAFKIIKRRFNIISTDDGFVGKKWLLRNIGCVPTMKFLVDPSLVKDMKYIVSRLHNSILLYPEASYSFDGCATPLPESIGKMIKVLGIPVVIIKTEGAYLHDPLYNDLKLRNVDVKAHMECILTKEDIFTMSASEINSKINSWFTFDNFKYQYENNVLIKEDFRSDNLNRVLYRCPYCNMEHMMEGKGITLKCKNCNTTLELLENGRLKAINKDTKFSHIPDWYNWERQCVKEEIIKGIYHEEMDVDIYCLNDLKAIYKVGKGYLTHDINGFKLLGKDNPIEFYQSSNNSYSLYSDFYWYEIGDVVCIGDYRIRYYCVPTNKKDIVAKLRLAAEEIYKLTNKK